MNTLNKVDAIVDKLEWVIEKAMLNYKNSEEALGIAIDHLKCIRDFDEDSPWDDPGACAKEALRKIEGVLHAN